MSYINIEPFHFACEEILFTEPNNDFIKCLNTLNQPVVFSVLLDDTRNPGNPVEINTINDLIMEQVYQPDIITILETSLRPIVLLLLEYLDSDLLLFSKRDVRLVTDRTKNKSQLLIRSINNDFDCRRLQGVSLLYKSKDTIENIRPTCVFYTVAWYLLRLFSSHKQMLEFKELSKHEQIIQNFCDILKNGQVQFLGNLVTNLPETFKPNEIKENNILNSFDANCPLFKLNFPHQHFYY